MTTVATPPKKRTRRPPPASLAAWWGEGPPPVERWPGVSIDIAAVWHTARGRWESPDGRFYFDVATADRATNFFPMFLKHFKGNEFAGEPFHLLPYQSALVVRPLFGWKSAATGLRRFRKVFIAIPKGNGKTPLGAGIGLYLTICDGESGAEVYSAAADRMQAGIMFDTAKAYVESDEELAEACDILARAITFPATRSTYQVLSADASTKHGFNVHGLLFDEFHAQKTRDLYEALYRGMVKRQQPVLVMVTTAGDDDEGICAEEWEYARRVQRDPSLDESYLPVVFEASNEEDWTQEQTWRRVNPGYGVTVKADALRSEAAAAALEPRKRNDFLRYHLNRWVNQATSWIPVEWWDACNALVPPDSVLRELPCAGAVDMAQKIDLACGLIAFRLPLEAQDEATTVEIVTGEPDAPGETREPVKRSVSLDYRVALVPAFFIPEETLRERVKQDRVPYDRWAVETANGLPLVFPVDGAILGADAIVRYFVGADGKGGARARFPRLKAAQLAYDPAFATDIALSLRDGYGQTTVEVLQNYKHLSEACQVFEALVKAKRILHGGHRLLRWNVENVAVKRDDAGRIRPVKPKRAAKRIDGVVAAIMAISRIMLLPPPTPKKKRRGPVIITADGPRMLVDGAWVPVPGPEGTHASA